MTVLMSHISWTNTTWNPTTGCTKVSAGCDHCYAEALTKRLWGGGFDQLRLHPDRLKQVRAFRPIRGADGRLLPRLVFVNSMSDLMHRDIPDAYRDQVFDAIETTPTTIYQVLTKRPAAMVAYADKRWGQGAIPDNVWLGVTAEDNRTRTRIDALRRMKDRHGSFTAFVSVEPLIASADAHEYRDIDWILFGGESGINARICEADWMRRAIANGHEAGAALWLKQWGQWRSNPLYRAANGPGHLDRVRQAIARGERMARIETDAKTSRERIGGEKGGATLDGEIYRELPPAYAALAAGMALPLSTTAA